MMPIGPGTLPTRPTEDEPQPSEQNSAFEAELKPEPAPARSRNAKPNMTSISKSSEAAEPASPHARADATGAIPQPLLQPKGLRMPAFAAGLLGGVVALAAGGLLQFAGILGSPGSTGGGTPALGEVDAEIAALKNRDCSA